MYGGTKALSDELSFWTDQSDTASVKIPELELELASGTLGGIVTTVEGLITKISESEYVFFFCQKKKTSMWRSSR